MAFAESFFDKTVKNTWNEFASATNGKKLSNLVGQSDEDKLAELCKIIDSQIQTLRPYQPISDCRILSNLCCRKPNHQQHKVVDICFGAIPPSLLLAWPFICSHLPPPLSL